jgi:DNA-binding FadR family transcriptional regulator
MKNRAKANVAAAASPKKWSVAGNKAMAPASGLLHARIVDQIGLRIVRGDLKPGDALPNGEEWAAMLGVSRTAFRESIKVLAGKGLIESRPKTGTRVRDSLYWNHLDPDVLAWRFGSGASDDAKDLFELRRVFEPAAAELAAMRATPAQIAGLEAAYRNMEAAGDDGEQFAGPDLVFHQLILRITGNQLIGSLAALIETALTTSFRLSDDNPAGQRQSLPLHLAVLDAVRARDGARAKAAMLTLLDRAEKDVRDSVAVRRKKAR